MSKHEMKNGSGAVRSSRVGKNEISDSVPLVSAKRGKFESLKDAKIEAMVFARMKDYKAFVKEIEGEEPEDGSVISVALELLFSADKGFERWQQEQRRKGRQIDVRNGNESVVKSSNVIPTS
jgi:hypothetical protein